MTIICGDCLDVMSSMEANSISSIVTDPPYGLGFMNKAWDAGLPHNDIWKEALRITKPGSFLLAFGGTRTYHRLTCAIEDAGWEIRDCLQWIYGSGFPKSHNHFGIEGYGTALKPAYEPIIMAMKPCDGTFKQNADKWGQAGINIEECRIGIEGATKRSNQADYPKNEDGSEDRLQHWARTGHHVVSFQKGRWPANVLFDEEAAAMLDEVSCINASRFFYCAKASSSERNEGNNHPTVKPLKLMEYLITLVMPPKDGVLLDPFAGSGSTILAAHKLGMKAIGIEKIEEYAEIARHRLENVKIDKKDQQLDFFEVPR